MRRFTRTRGELGVLRDGEFRHRFLRNGSLLVQLFTEQLL